MVKADTIVLLHNDPIQVSSSVCLLRTGNIKTISIFSALFNSIARHTNNALITSIPASILLSDLSDEDLIM